MARDYNAEILGAEQQRKTAQALRQSAMQAPEGKMIGGWYVPPSWSQYASQALNSYFAAKDEKAAAEAQKEAATAKQEELAKLLRSYGKKEEVKPTDALMNSYAQNQPQGTMTDAAIRGYQPNIPMMTQTQQVPLNTNEQLAQDVRLQQLDPEAARMMEARQTREDAQAARMEQMRLANELKAQQAQQGGNAYYQPLQTANGVFAFNARTGKVEQVQGPQGQPIVGAQFDPSLQGNIAGAKTAGQEYAKQGAEVTQHVKDAKESNSLLAQVEEVGPKATGSALGALRDVAGNVVGVSTEGAKAAAKMNVLGASLVSKVPKMSGPQSDKDAAMYKQAAGDIANPSVPWEQKKAAIAVIKEINNRQISYGNTSGQSSSSPKVLRFDAQGNPI